MLLCHFCLCAKTFLTMMQKPMHCPKLAVVIERVPCNSMSLGSESIRVKLYLTAASLFFFNIKVPSNIKLLSADNLLLYFCRTFMNIN